MVRHEVATVLSAGPSPDAKGVVRKWRCSLERITHFKREKKARFIGWEKRSEQGVVPFARHVTIYEVGLGRKNTERKRKARDSEVGQTTGPWTRHYAEPKEVGPWGAVYPGDMESLERKEAVGNSYIPRRPHYYYLIITINCIYFIYLPIYFICIYLTVLDEGKKKGHVCRLRGIPVKTKLQFSFAVCVLIGCVVGLLIYVVMAYLLRPVDRPSE